MTEIDVHAVRRDRIDQLRAEMLALFPIVSDLFVQTRLQRAWQDVDQAVALLGPGAALALQSPLAVVDALLGLASSRLSIARDALEALDGDTEEARPRD